MKQIKFNISLPKGDDTGPGQKNPRKKAPARTLWIAPALTVSAAAVLLILFSAPDPSHGQTISNTQITLSFNHGRNRPLKRDYGVDGLRLQPFKSSDRAAELTQLNAGDHNGHHNYVPIQTRYLHRATHHD